MESILYQRIKTLCNRKNIAISKLENELGFGSSSIRKWGNPVSPSADKIEKVAEYFDVSLDYLVGRTDIEESAPKILGDKDIISIQRARQKMPPKDKERMMKMLNIGFEYAFPDKGDDV